LTSSVVASVDFAKSTDGAKSTDATTDDVTINEFRV